MELLEKVLKKRSEADRKKDAKKKAKWAKTAAGKKSALKSKKRAEKVRKGSVRVDKERAKSAKKTAKLYNGYSFKEFNESKSASGYEIYHKDFSTAMQHAYKMAKKLASKLAKAWKLAPPPCTPDRGCLLGSPRGGLNTQA